MTHEEAMELVLVAVEIDPGIASHVEHTRAMVGIDDGLRWEVTAERLQLLKFRSEELAVLVERWRRSRGQA